MVRIGNRSTSTRFDFGLLKPFQFVSIFEETRFRFMIIYPGQLNSESFRVPLSQSYLAFPYQYLLLNIWNQFLTFFISAPVFTAVPLFSNIHIHIHMTFTSKYGLMNLSVRFLPLHIIAHPTSLCLKSGRKSSFVSQANIIASLRNLSRAFTSVSSSNQQHTKPACQMLRQAISLVNV